MDTFFKSSVDFAKKTLITQGCFHTMIIGEINSIQKLAFIGTFENEKEKQSFLNLVSLAFLSKQVKRYVVISEAWIKSIGAESSDIFNNETDEDKVECLIAIEVLSGNTSGKGLLFEIKRSGSLIIDLEEKTVYDRIEGRFTKLLLNKEMIPSFSLTLVNDFIDTNGLTFH